MRSQKLLKKHFKCETRANVKVGQQFPGKRTLLCNIKVLQDCSLSRHFLLRTCKSCATAGLREDSSQMQLIVGPLIASSSVFVFSQVVTLFNRYLTALSKIMQRLKKYSVFKCRISEDKILHQITG